MEEQSKAPLWRYVGGFFVTVAAIALGNLLAVILTSIWDWQNLDNGKPGGVALAAVQGVVGAVLAGTACEKWLSMQVALFWLKIYAIIVATVFVVLLAVSIYKGRVDVLFIWSILSAVVYVSAIELVRRVMRSDGI